jgi:phthalate 4,5-cis-dihydrodiol dehydrogenase
LGGGVIFSQAAHQLDIVRLLGGGLVNHVSAQVGAWDPIRPTEGAYSAVLGFAGGAFASVSYSGYAHFDSDQWMGQIGELGHVKDPNNYGAAKKRLSTLSSSDQEAQLKASRNYGAEHWDRSTLPDDARSHQHFGPLIISCDRADLRPVPTGVWIDGDRESVLLEIPKPVVPRQEVIDELYDAIFKQKPVLHSGQWARATTELSLAILESSRKQAMVSLQFQIKPYQHL